ncbi:hypothetical protein LZ023_40650 (plasmid) [Pseudomonas silvicola]|nr:hypothetical protein LZ023_40925 [Pseudomonas silvicola]WAH62245.1 hypothetical protein LZ023_40650 [Pseudomonas silvicola]
MAEQSDPGTLERVRKCIQLVRDADDIASMLHRAAWAGGYLNALHVEELIDDTAYAKLIVELSRAKDHFGAAL